MSAKSKHAHAIGFPPPLLGELPLRLAVLAEALAWLALDKPAGLGTRTHPWDGCPDLDHALNLQLSAGKPELLRTQASCFGSIYYLDPVISGVALFAKNRESLADLRNSFGSVQCQFTFHFVSANPDFLESTLLADAPLLPHATKAKMIPSTAKGKKSSTRLTRLASGNEAWALWEAKSDFIRPHQVRAHAATLGLPVLGDSLYGGPEIPTIGQLELRSRRSDMAAPIFEGVAIHLVELIFPFGQEQITLQSPHSKAFQLLLKRLGLVQS